MMAAGIFGYIRHGGFNYHIDFVGGTELQVSFDNLWKLVAYAVH